MDLKQFDFLIAGQLKTSRTEIIEEYLKDKVKCLCVIGFTSPYATSNFGRCTLYENGKLTKQFSFPFIRLKGPYWLTQPLLML